MPLKQLNNFMLTLKNKPKIKSKHYSHKTPRLKKPKRDKLNPSLKLWGEENNKWKTKLKLSHNCYTIDGTCKSEGLVSSEKNLIKTEVPKVETECLSSDVSLSISSPVLTGQSPAHLAVYILTGYLTSLSVEMPWEATQKALHQKSVTLLRQICPW